MLSSRYHSSDPAEDASRYSPFIGRLSPRRGSARLSDAISRHLPSRDDEFDLQSLDGSPEDTLTPADRGRYQVEPIDDDWVQIGPSRGSEGEYETGWPGADLRRDDWPPLPPPREQNGWPLGESDDDWVQIGSPEDGDWGAGSATGRWRDRWSKRSDVDGAEPEWAPLGRSERDPDREDVYSGPERNHEQGQKLEQEPKQEPELEREETAASLASQLAQFRQDSSGPEEDTARQLHAIRHAFLQQAESSDVQRDSQQGPDERPQQGPRVAALQSAQRLNMRKRLAAGVGEGEGLGRRRYMPWLLIASIAVGSVAAVLGVSTVSREQTSILQWAMIRSFKRKCCATVQCVV